MDIFKTRIKVILRRRDNVFWAFIFPLLLGLFFHLGFGSLSEDNFLETTEVYIEASSLDNALITAMENVEIKDGKKLFILNQEHTKDELEVKLIAEEITGFVYGEDNEVIFRITNSGLTQTIVKSFLDQYMQINALVTKVVTTNPEVLPNVLSDLETNVTYFTSDLSSADPNANVLTLYFYALIAMACLFAAYWGINLVNDVSANMSDLGVRVEIAPTHRLKLIIIYFLAALLVHYIGNILLILFLKYILGVAFTDNIFLISLISLVGTISGIALGAFLSALIKGSRNFKEGIVTSVTLVLSALSGLMFLDLKYYVESALPIIKYINPASSLTDAFNSLYYYNDYSMYAANIINLVILSVVFIFLTYILMRGKKYDSI